MKGKFIIEVPLKGFSKHDDPATVASILTEIVVRSLKKWETLTGFLPFDIEKTTARFEAGR
jgi:hypothetical protein